MEKDELNGFMDTLAQNFSLSEVNEVTLEANPDDITDEKLRTWKAAGINRLSIGIQSLDEAALRYMNRSHSANQGMVALEKSLRAGFENLSADLIYGIPAGRHDAFQLSFENISALPVGHLSCYALTVEPHTALELMIRKKKSAPVDEQQTVAEFEQLLSMAEQTGFEQYEISNFARNGSYAKHNSSYWTGSPYLGIGPSAHSYTGNIRNWNVANNAAYIRSLARSELPHTSEALTPQNRFNEYMMTSLRTVWGMNTARLAAINPLPEDFFAALHDLEQRQLLAKNSNGNFVLTRKGKLMADGIISQLLIV
jgi:oxygen-independent coproporphyrinogen-3 oxidase